MPHKITSNTETNADEVSIYQLTDGNGKTVHICLEKWGIVGHISYLIRHYNGFYYDHTSLFDLMSARMKSGDAFWQHYWWYEGRKYMDSIFEDWYRCWKYEFARSLPRPMVVNQLAKDMSKFGIYALPCLNQAVRSGDKTLGLVLGKIGDLSGMKIPTDENFTTWYATNSYKFVLPPVEGLEAAKKRIKDPEYVRELCGTNVNSNVNFGMSFILEVQSFCSIQKLEQQFAEYASNPDAVPNYWYYKLGDDVEELDELPSFWSTNYNPKFLKAISDEKKR